ncbi:MAG: carbohydrate ABC transporter permease [Chloroflexi bacterium]|nr:carbohydrate ABC transporter permease [Chloroflexota bacterium]
MSFRSEADAFKMPPNVFAPLTLQNYQAVLEGKFVRALSNSAITSTSTTVLSLLLGVPAAYALSRARFGAERYVELWMLATRMAPPIAFGIPFFLIYKRLDLIDTREGLIVIYLTFNLSLVIWMMRTFFDGLPVSLEEAAYIDGAGVLGTFLRVTLPLATPGLATTAIFCFLVSWNDFFYALILARSDALTAPVAIVNFMNYESWEYGKIGAGGTLIMLPVVAFSLLVRKYLVRGLTAGAVKG